MTAASPVTVIVSSTALTFISPCSARRSHARPRAAPHRPHRRGNRRVRTCGSRGDQLLRIRTGPGRVRWHYEHNLDLLASSGSHYALALAAEGAGDRQTASAEFKRAMQYWNNAGPGMPEIARASREPIGARVP